MTRPRPRAALALVLAAAAALALAACSGTAQAGGSSSAGGTSSAGSDHVDFRVAYLPTANYLTTLKGTNTLQTDLAKVGATATFIGPLDPFDAYNTVTSGHADASSTGTGYFVDLAAQNSGWVAFALEKYSGKSQGIVAAPGSGVTSLKDLYGKKVGIDGDGATGDYLVNQAFAHAGLDVSKVQKVTLSAADFSAAFTSGKIDALASYDQNLANAIATPGAKTLVTADQIGSYNWSIHIVSRDFATKHPQALKQAYEALVAEAARAKAKPSIITDAYTQFGASKQVTDVVKTFDVPTIEPLDATAVADLQKLAQQYVAFGFIKTAPDISQYVVDESK